MEIKPTNAQDIECALKDIFRFIGENPDRAGLKDTPQRIIKMWMETMRGYDPEQLPKVTTFDNGSDGIGYNQLITDSGNYYSNCEHHFVPFFGQYYFGYIPHKQGKILGLSKVARVVDYFSARLQIQERLCSDIVQYLFDELKKGSEYPPLAIGIVMKGEHLCKSMRGAKKQGIMTTSCLWGNFESDKLIRKEFLDGFPVTK